MSLEFTCKETKKVWDGIFSKKIPYSIQNIARRKLRMLAAANTLSDLQIPPGNKLEALKGNRKGQHSIRINKQWRICFVWKNFKAINIEIVDYH